MPKKIVVAGSDRYIYSRNGNYSYRRRIPSEIGPRDARWPIINVSLKTSDLAEARLKRDLYERADDEFWGDLLGGEDMDSANNRHKMLVARAKRIGFKYKHLPNILSEESGAEIWGRLQALNTVKPGSDDATAIIGGEPVPKVKISEAHKFYKEEIAAPELVGKSEKQKKVWLKVKNRAVSNFIEVCGDKNIDEITRDDAKQFYNFWRSRIAPSDGSEPTAKPDTGNRDIGNMRVLLREYFKHQDGEIRPTPFDNLGFAEGQQVRRLSYPTEWLEKVFLNSPALSKLNDEARAIFYICLETGARPSEICNLTAKAIHLEHQVPHISIAPITDKGGRREVKTPSSIRRIPLVGVALEAAKKFPNGFPRYRDKEDGFSQIINKHLSKEGVSPGPDYTMYSLRHSFEDRMKEAKLDSELRMALMGHTNTRPQYGQGGSLAWMLDGLKLIELPFDCAVV